MAGLVLAAGGGSRIGLPKALLVSGGTLLVDRAAALLAEAGCSPVVVVLGAGADDVREAAHFGMADVVVNQDWRTGLGSSLRSGLAALTRTDAWSVAVTLVDTPGVTVAAVERVVAVSAGDASLACATYGGRRGHPMVLGRAHWPGIAASALGDVGARPYLARHGGIVLEVPCDDLGSDDDVDTPVDAAAHGIDLNLP